MANGSNIFQMLLVFKLRPLSHLPYIRRDAADQSGWSTDEISRRPRESIRSQYGLTLYAAKAKHEITFQIGLRIEHKAYCI